MLSWDWLKSKDWVSWLRLRPIFLLKAMALAETDFSSSLALKLGIRLPPSMRGKNDFWGAQNFWSHYQDVHSPVMIWGNKNDSLVPFDENAGTLNQENVGVVKFPVGYHCTLPIGYDWSALSSLVQANLISQGSPSKLEIDSVRIDLAPSYDSKPESWFIDQIEWLGDQPQDVGLHLRHRAFPQQNIHALIPLKRLDFRFRNSQLSLSERQMTERWIFQNVQIVRSLGDTQRGRSISLQWKRAP
jgi:hypothetical protein